MSPLDVLERWLRPVAMPYLAAVLAAAQITTFVWVLVAAPNDPQRVLEPISLVPSQVLAGEWWRLITFLAVPPTLHPLWAALGWLCLVMLGSALERTWGTARFNLFLLLGWLATSAVAFLVPGAPSTNGFILLSVFLAFATLAPETVFQLFFVIPVKAKWLALFTWCMLGFALVVGSWETRVAVLASVANWTVFFLPMVLRDSRARAARAARSITPSRREAFHRCIACGRTDLTNPELEFRYCDQCDGAPGYCLEHLSNHTHRRRADPAPSRPSTTRE